MKLTVIEKNQIIQKIMAISESFLDAIDEIEKASTYKTRKEIKLTDKELKDRKQEFINGFILLIRNFVCLEQYVEKKGLKEESQEFIKLVIIEFKKRKEKREQG
jgi:hypothetical protein